MMPSKELFASLRDCLKAFDAATDDKTRLEVSRKSLSAVLQYLQCDPEITAGGLLRPIYALKTAAYDAGQGATVALLDHQPKAAGKPSGTARETVQGVMAFVVELLVASKFGTGQAISWTEEQARKQGICAEDGKPVAARQIKAWRDEIKKGRAPAEACDVFENCRRLVPPLDKIRAEIIADPDQRPKCELHARILLQTIATIAGRSAPRQKIATH